MEFEKAEAIVQPQTAAQGLDNFFFNVLGVSKKDIDPFVSQCTVRVVDRPQNFAGNGPSGSRIGSLYVMHSDLRNESKNHCQTIS